MTRPSHHQSDADVPLRNYSLTHSADDQQQEEQRRWLMDENKAISTSQRLTASAGDAVSSLAVRALDLRLDGHEFDSQPPRLILDR